MRPSKLSFAGAFFASTAAAFQNTSPFVLLSSTADLKLDESHVATSSDLQAALQMSLGGCPADSYLLVSQPGLHSSDLKDGAMPTLQELVQSAKSAYTKQHVLFNDESAGEVYDFLTSHCDAMPAVAGADSSSYTLPAVMTLELHELPSKEKARKTVAAANDMLLREAVRNLPDNYVLLMSSPTALAVDDTANLDESPAPQANSTITFGDSVFAKYQFFSPGIFQATIVAFLLLYILFQGLSWLSSLEVSYKAFEAPPQKKQKLQ